MRQSQLAWKQTWSEVESDSEPDAEDDAKRYGKMSKQEPQGGQAHISIVADTSCCANGP